MSDAARINSDPAAKPVRRGFPDKNFRLDFKGNFNRIAEFTKRSPARQNARRGNQHVE
jgi:hypothetical protein